MEALRRRLSPSRHHRQDRDHHHASLPEERDLARRLRDWNNRRLQNQMIIFKREHPHATFADFIGETMPENIRRGVDGTVEWIDDRLLGDNWQGAFLNAAAEQALHEEGPMPELPGGGDDDIDARASPDNRQPSDIALNLDELAELEALGFARPGSGSSGTASSGDEAGTTMQGNDDGRAARSGDTTHRDRRRKPRHRDAKLGQSGANDGTRGGEVRGSKVREQRRQRSRRRQRDRARDLHSAKVNESLGCSPVAVSSLSSSVCVFTGTGTSTPTSVLHDLASAASSLSSLSSSSSTPTPELTHNGALARPATPERAMSPQTQRKSSAYGATTPPPASPQRARLLAAKVHAGRITEAERDALLAIDRRAAKMDAELERSGCWLPD